MRASDVIAGHGNTDFDAFGSMLAARLLYPEATVALAGTVNRNVREFARLHADELGLVDVSRLELDAIRRLIVVETVHASRLGELEPVVRDPAVETIVFDHHGDELEEWADETTAVQSDDGALTTTMVGILAERELVPTPTEATAFALGIHEDTGSLTYATTTQRDVDALAWCLRHGARQDLLGEYLHLPLAASERDLLHALSDALEPVAAGDAEVLVAAVQWHEYVDGISNLAHKLVDLTDARALLLLVEMEDRVFCVVRSRTDAIDAEAVARALGGGGHPYAASAIAREPLDDVRRRALDALPEAAREPVRARNVMSTPARSVPPDEQVARTMALCQRHGQSGMFVVEGGRLAGSVSREDLDKAIGHGLSHAPVKGIMSGSTVCCGEETPLAELRQLVLDAEDGRVAVLDGEELVGVVTRSDLLRALEGPGELEEAEAPSLAAELRALERLTPITEAIASLGERPEGVYLVGGTVRDILLGEPGFDIDIAIEGDAIAFAAKLARALEGTLRTHRKFGTATIGYGDGETVDLVTARTEFYDAPAALPTVERATIREDLFRRDFTLNAMAVSLAPEDLGRLVDPFGGRRDLERRTLRVLHNLSFIDDPTRIFRAIRYESRYGLRLEAHSERLARGCVEMGLVRDLSASRLRDELQALLEEERARDAILRLGELGADRGIHPHLEADEEAAGLHERVVELRTELGIDAPLWRLGLAVLARKLSPDEVVAWLDSLTIRRRDAELVAGAVTVAPRIVDRLSSEHVPPAELLALADPYAPDAPLLALALADLEQLRDYFARLRNVRLEIGGAELAELGLKESPRVGEILGELRRRKLNGELDGRESELAAARELVAQST
jgi:tRNA nucleotidyltransferase (CCA-adding enzyme)